jgi:single-stranded-DNA-specific exonuclease
MISQPRIERRVVADESGLPPELPSVIRRVLASRGIADLAQIDTSLRGLHPATALGGLEAAVDLIEYCLRHDEPILIIGDFDADGATSTALAVRALRAMGAATVDYLVPNRFEFGYGLTPEIVALAADRRPALIITVDNGVSSIEGVAAAQAAGIKVVITDHHLPGRTLPAADAMVNPNLVDDAFPSKNLAGVGVIFYVMSALRARLREGGWFQSQHLTEPRMAELLDLVALGTVADVVVMDANNRRLVGQGLARIRAGRCNSGISALIDISGRQREQLTTSDLGFALGPRLNAAGRLADMSLGIECLISDRNEHCAVIAEQLDKLNRERRDIEAEMRDHAFDLIDGALPDTENAELPAAFCVHHEQWHQGVIGIVAARVKDRFHRPVIAFASVDGGTLKGSARSIPGIHIRDVLDAVASRNPGLISRFGGHAMAAGLTLPAEQYSDFMRAFVNVVGEYLDAETRDKKIASDGELASSDFNLDLARELAHLAPWGQGFPEPRFDGVFKIEDRRVVGGTHAKLVLSAEGHHETVAAIAFGAAVQPWFADAESIRAVFKLDINNYRGIDTLQLVIDHAEPA